MSENNPYQAPEASLSQENQHHNADFELTGPKSVKIGRGWAWLTEGFGHFKKNPLAWILVIVIYFVISLMAGIIPVIGQLALALLTFVWAGGFMLGCRAQTEGKDFQVTHLFSGFSNNTGQLVLLSLIYLIAVIAIFAIAMGPMFSMFIKISTSSPFADPAEFMQGVDMMQFALSMLIASSLAIPLLMLFWFAPALMVINKVPLFQAMKLSFMGCIKNILPFLWYGLICFVLLIIAIISFGLGLLILIPMLIASIYTSYRDIFIN